MNKLKNSIILLIFFFLSNISFGQTLIDSIVEKEAKSYMTNENTIGLSIGVSYNTNNLMYNFGIQKTTNSEPPTENSIYCIGSISKTFVTLLLSKAIFDKKVKLQDDITKYLPDSIKFNNLQFDGNPIRLLHLCNHTSRIPSQLAKLPQTWNSFTPDEKYLFKKKYTQNLFLQDLATITLDTIPGSKYEYSNAGVKLLSIILEKIYQIPYDKIIEKYISNDLNMTDTKVYLNKKDWESFAIGRQDLSLLTRTKDIDDYTSGPVLNSTVNNMLKYLSFNISEKSKSVKLSHKTTFVNNDNVEIGLAWRIKYASSGEKYFYHLGSGWGCNSICLFSPTKKIGVVVLANETTDQNKIFELGTNLLTKILAMKN